MSSNHATMVGTCMLLMMGCGGAQDSIQPAEVISALHQETRQNGCTDDAWSWIDPGPGVWGRIINSGEDTIWYRYSLDMPGNEIRVTLSSASGVTWFKGVEVRAPFAGMINQADTNGSNHGPNQQTVDTSMLVTSELSLRFVKAKAFGIHTGMYCLEGLSGKEGHTLDFYWSRD